MYSQNVATNSQSARQLAPPETVGWTSLDAVLTVAGAFVIYLAGSIAVGIVAYGLQGAHPGVWVDPASYAFLTLGVFAMIHWLLVIRRGASWRGIGYRLRDRQRVLRAVIAGMVAVWVGISAIAWLLDHLTTFHVAGNARELLPNGASHLTLPQYIVLLFLVAVMAPITEETLFRGVLYQAIRRDSAATLPATVSVAVAAVLSGTVFGLIHIIGGSDVVHALPVLVYFGIVLGITFQYADSLYASMLLHAVNNALAVTTLFVH